MIFSFGLKISDTDGCGMAAKNCRVGFRADPEPMERVSRDCRSAAGIRQVRPRRAVRPIPVPFTQIRLAYTIGADLGTVALCRATTELLIRYHYANDHET